MSGKAVVHVFHGGDRQEAATALLEAVGAAEMGMDSVLVKPNFNTADPSPGSTHVDTLRAVIDGLRSKEPCQITIADRSGPAETRQVFAEKGIFELAAKMKFETMVLEEQPSSEYVKVIPENGHWKDGFLFARVAQNMDTVCLCCLKTHMYGGHFTMSLKLTTGLVHRSNMRELHASRNIRDMIAEMNLAFEPRFIIMDGVRAFYEGGPMSGSIWNANLSFASTDRVALDAVGVAALKMHGTTHEIEGKKVFEQNQIKRAAELGIGVGRTEDIEMRPVGQQSEIWVDRISKHLYDGS